MRDAAALRRVLPDYDRIGRLLAAHDAIVALPRRGRPRGGHRPRPLVPAHGRDGRGPGDGSAVGPLAAHVAARTGVERLEVDQGVEMGRPSRLVASLDGDRVRVGGDVVILAEGTVHLLDT